jgi:hypothetical protein
MRSCRSAGEPQQGGHQLGVAPGLDAELRQSLRAPMGDNEVIEVRQVQEMSDFPADVKEAAAGFEELQRQSGQGI